MKRVILGCSLIGLLLTGAASAQDEGEVKEPAPVPQVKTEPSLPELTPSQMSPEMYLYLHEQRRQDDPKQAVRRKAEIRSAARTGRIQAMKWYGMSNSRPQANPVPFMGNYSPTWIGNGYDRYDWYGMGWPSVTLRVEKVEVVR